MIRQTRTAFVGELIPLAAGRLPAVLQGGFGGPRMPSGDCLRFTTSIRSPSVQHGLVSMADGARKGSSYGGAIGWSPMARERLRKAVSGLALATPILKA
ncbi:hypothetical protein [Poseidonocella sp. HB161398]|uniref:hypothetical protein n=1 Tax=Poseidonocella sp. HB161398 TaxID=2320855 RepID=UPI001108DACB|nr:hypothetical protein [Poseidonocella sp. HB161398]